VIRSSPSFLAPSRRAWTLRQRDNEQSRSAARTCLPNGKRRDRQLDAILILAASGVSEPEPSLGDVQPLERFTGIRLGPALGVHLAIH
jgi:hypothetical protein